MVSLCLHVGKFNNWYHDCIVEDACNDCLEPLLEETVRYLLDLNSCVRDQQYAHFAEISSCRSKSPLRLASVPRCEIDNRIWLVGRQDGHC